MKEGFFSELARSFSVELPVRDSLDEYLDLILPEIRQWGEDLAETQFYSQPGGKPWQEIRDNKNFHETILHFFNENGEYLQSIDGNIIKGKWRLLDNTNKMIIEMGGGKTELYNLVFLSNAFFILNKHGDQSRKKQAKYFVMGYEPYVAGIEWRDYVEMMFNTYRSQSGNYKTIAIILLIVLAVIAFFSLY